MRSDRKTITPKKWMRAFVGCMFTTLVATSHVVQAQEWGGVVGSFDGIRRQAVIYQTAPLLQKEFAGHPLDLSLEYSLGTVRAPSATDNRELWQVGITPFARWWFASNTGVEMGLGVNLFSGVQLGDKDISSAFQFGSSAGLIHRLQGTPWLIGLRFSHFSNASLKEPNQGQDYLQLHVRYVF